VATRFQPGGPASDFGNIVVHAVAMDGLTRETLRPVGNVQAECGVQYRIARVVQAGGQRVYGGKFARLQESVQQQHGGLVARAGPVVGAADDAGAHLLLNDHRVRDSRENHDQETEQVSAHGRPGKT
jgi:hypothetical protein